MRRPHRTPAGVLAVALAVALGVSGAACGSGPPYADERTMCSALQRLVDARATGDATGERAAMAVMRRTSLRTQNINFALFGQAFTGVPQTRRIPTAFDRLVNECLRVGLPIRGVRIPPSVPDQ
ncbi:MAG: hypothetical protein ACRDZW_00360 [Acidimicrobiales bacterium]